MNDNTFALKATIEPIAIDIINHPLYAQISDIDDLKIFMQYHIYAVWDFMSLLKSLQQNLTCTAVPWYPVGNADTRYLINEIVAGEESDVDENGIRTSHFELYLAAMEQSGADTSGIKTFINTLQQTNNFQTAFEAANTPAAARKFVEFTFSIINSSKLHLQSAIFTFGREDLIPGMFLSIIRDFYKAFPESMSIFKYYIERHIEVDGDHHSNLAIQMTENLCGTNEAFWLEAREAVVASLQIRKSLWDAVYSEIMDYKLANA